MIAGIGLALVGFTACGGFIYTQIQEYNSMMEQQRESKPVVKWIKCEPIETTEIEYQKDDDVVIMDIVGGMKIWISRIEKHTMKLKML